ncbi:DUF1853 family protein [Aliagarivorans marinus]|uniref:DUF1853 family protein n=1 Tax=Aliagarivorans marinus TaxID=561965 RepID=UPI00041745EB|nr:DUF1853 family protein [Aliagarivorans marinus]
MSDYFTRDLSWCLEPPRLLPHPAPYLADSGFYQRWREELDVSTLHNTPRPQIKRLGLYFEACWRQLIALHPEWELLIDNRAIVEGGRTIGAIDFVVINHQQQCLEHWELAVKFYLATCANARIYDYLGPNQQDRLSNKLSKLLLKQLPLIRHPQLQAEIAPYRHYQFKQRMLLCGYLFSPWQAQSSEHQWCEYADWRARFDTTQWQAIGKQDWLSAKGSVEKNTEELVGGALSRPIQLVHKQTQARLFVCPDGWLAAAKGR